jgi:hypothetical protein
MIEPKRIKRGAGIEKMKSGRIEEEKRRRAEERSERTS